MRPKEFIDMFPYGYTRLRNQNGSVALRLETKCTDAYVFVKKTRHRMSPISQSVVDEIQSGCDNVVIVDWFNDDTCRYLIMTKAYKDRATYRLALNAFFGEETFEVTGDFFEKEHENHRKRVYSERYLKNVSPDALTTENDFMDERYDIIFPDDALSHCRRLGNVIMMSTIYSTESSVHNLGDLNTHNNESLEDNNESDIE
ncbi:MAG: hypothetical protein IKO21_02540 [Fibrobacter sp.]|nr:hypothetical protein [Fibrobacter sp.]